MNVSGTFWTRKYRQHISAMIGLCYRYVPDRATAEDLAHDAFLRAMESADTLKAAESFDYWLTRITVNTAVTHLREKVSVRVERQGHELEELPDLESDIPPESMLEAIRQADFTQEEIVEAIAQLPEHHRTVLNLYVFEKRTHRQIAELLGISPNTSKSHLMRARKELQVILFQKSKRKKTLLMTHVLPLFGVDAAFDRYCRRQVNGFAMSPQHPFTTQHIQSAAPAKLPLRMRYHALRVPVAAGLGAAAVGAMLIPAVSHHYQPAPPVTPNPVPVAVTVSEPAADTTATTDQVEAQTSEQQTVKKASRPEAQAVGEAQETVANTDNPPDTAAAAPVVVKKIVRRSNKTIVIKDSNNRKQ